MFGLEKCYIVGKIYLVVVPHNFTTEGVHHGSIDLFVNFLISDVSGIPVYLSGNSEPRNKSDASRAQQKFVSQEGVILQRN